MAAKSTRRWYQFSLRALVLLMLVSSIPPGIYVGYQTHLEAKRRAEIESDFRWLESLELPDLSRTRADPELRTIARQALQHARAKDRDPFERFGSDLSTRGELFILACACWREGHVGLGRDLHRAAEANLDWRDGDVPQSFRARVAADLAYAATWRATRACGTETPRQELLAEFRRLQKHFPQSKYAQDVAQKVAVLEIMVAEDERRARERAAGVPFEQLSQSEQIAELIFQLRDQNGQQWSQPGSCDVLATPAGQDNSPGHRLLTYGYEAIPQLAAAVGDERLTRSVGFHRDYYFSHHVLTIGDAAEQLLEHIASRRFDTADRYESPEARAAAMRENALAWHAALKTKGELACLVEAVERADESSVSLARRLLKQAPDAACSAILAALRKTDDEYKQVSFIELLGRIPSDESIPLLLEELQHENVRVRLAVAEALTALNRPEGIDEMLRQWRSSRQVVELEGVGPFLASCNNAEAIDAVAARFSQQSIDERLETLERAADRSSETFAARPELRTAVIQLLLLALGDTDVRAGMAGSFGDKSFRDPRVCDLAGYHLNCLDAAAFPFDLGGPLLQREEARQAILAQHGKP